MGTHNPENRHFLSAALAAAVVLAGCKEPPQNRRTPVDAAEKRGLALIEATGCGACHEIPGLRWPRSRLAPSLTEFGAIGLIAGSVPNTPANLAAFVREPQAVKPGSTMPPMPISEAEAADIAAYLYGLRDD